MNETSPKVTSVIPDPNAPAAVRRRRIRQGKDHFARYAIGVGGISVILAVVLIAFYLFYVVVPMFLPADIEAREGYAAPGGGKTLLVAMEEQGEVGVRFTDQGEAVFFSVADGAIRDSVELPLPEGVFVSSVAEGVPGSGEVALGLSDGTALVLKHRYRVTYPNNQRLITPHIEYPLGETPLVIDRDGIAIDRIAIMNQGDGATAIAAETLDGRLLYTRYEVEESLMGDVEITPYEAVVPSLPTTVSFVSLSLDLRWIFAADEAGTLYLINVADTENPYVADSKVVRRGNERITAMKMLMGGISVIIGTSDGRIEQWFGLRDANNRYALAFVREFHEHAGAIRYFAMEPQRKGFLAMDEHGDLGIFHTTAERVVLMQREAVDGQVTTMGIGPRSDHLLAATRDERMHVWDVDNKHPDVSFSALWQEVWYESYPEPDYVWQSSAANQDFEPKFSLSPLAFGTLKAAFYAMLIAMPLAIMGAIFTAYFMNPKLRQTVKPTIEIMEALPTVILGFLAGLWFAPFVEENLPGIFMLLVGLPLGVLLFAYAWHRLPRDLKSRIPGGWQPLIIIPVLALVGWVSIALSAPVEVWLFDGNMRSWLTNEAGINFDQRNAIVVGFAMGFAVIPTIFSITEDAIFGVPKHLTNGSLALGATPWQTLTRVVLPSASPGIFSGVMIGLGRAVGETMIVLMATGNTAVMDWNIFEGMRTLSANIAVEMPESAVGSTHYRTLFLAALVLFLFTFVLNTLAELIRQRLRRKYASL